MTAWLLIWGDEMIGRATVLLIDDNTDEVASLSAHLNSQGFETYSEADPSSGLRRFFNLRPDFVVVDLDVGESGGWPLIGRLRELASTPVVVLAPQATNAYVSRAFQNGVSDFLARPFRPSELSSRLNAIQTRRDDADDPVYRHNGLVVDFRSCEVMVHGRSVQLTGTEYRLLTYLIEHRGWVLSRERILNRVWGIDYVGETDQVKLYIWYLRRKLEADPKHPQMILTKRGLGYSFVG